MARFSDLPEELVVEILAFLPVDSLMRFKCVQKSWYSLIANSKFVAKQLRNQINKKNSCLLLKSELSEGKNILSFLSFDNKTETSAGENHASDVGKIVKIPLDTDRLYFPFLGHCHGIVCLGWRNTQLTLVNPAMREFRELPVSCFHHPWQGPSNARDCWPLAIGFGYDPKSNDYKVVRILSFMHVSPRIKGEVYTLSTDSWRQINNINPFGAGICFLQRHECLYFSGACYWMAWSDFGEKENFILSFDMSDEVFRKIPVPNSSFNTGKESWSIMAWNETLALVLLDTSLIEHPFEIWIMDEFGVNGTWKKLFAIESSPRLERPLGFWKNDELIIEDRNGMLCCYNLNTKVIKDLHLHIHTGAFSAVTYTSSLVSTRGGNKLDWGDYNFNK